MPPRGHLPGNTPGTPEMILGISQDFIMRIFAKIEKNKETDHSNFDKIITRMFKRVIVMFIYFMGIFLLFFFVIISVKNVEK
jgi:hypothetical protein